MKRAANGRMTDSGFKQKAMKTTKPKKIEVSAPANVRPLNSVQPFLLGGLLGFVRENSEGRYFRNSHKRIRGAH
ncbi:MAG: hypothetical protein P4N60_00530 [Verrucomicrobiae bacterium]|nr:hypothetical protein [Verrucomicrobiae bacterium]